MQNAFSINALSTRLIAMLVINFVLVIAIANYCLHALKDANGLAHEIHHEISLPSKYISDTYRNQITAHVQFTEAINMTGEERSERIQIFEDFTAASEAKYIQFREQPIPSDMTHLVDQFDSHLTAYKTIYKRLREKLHQNDISGILLTVESDLRPHNVGMGQLVGDMLETFEAHAQHNDELGKQNYIAATQWVISISSLGLAAATLIGFFGIRALNLSIRHVHHVLEQMASGKFNISTHTRGAPSEIARLLTSVEKMKSSLNDILGEVDHTAKSVQNATNDISANNADLADRVQRQASSLEETSHAMQEMTHTVRQNAADASRASELASTARDRATKGGDVVNRAVQAMDELNTSSAKVVDIVTLIDEISFQTNLLALNAAVEAARAGDQGRGFAIVAGEVRHLAQRSASAAQEIKVLIGDSSAKVDASNKWVNESGKTLSDILESIKEVTGLISRIAIASDAQADGIEGVNLSISDMETVTQANAAMVEEAAVSSEEMHHLAQQLKNQVSYFDTSTDSGSSLAGQYRPGEARSYLTATG